MRSSLVVALFGAAACPAAANVKPADSAAVTLGFAGAPFVGVHASAVGQTHVGGSPVPIVELSARLGDVEFHSDGVPYARTGRYGDPLDPSQSTVQTGEATVRVYTSSQFAFGVGYGLTATTTDRVAPPGSFSSFADGVRLELHERLRVDRAGRLELTFGGMPQLAGTLRTYPGIPRALNRYDPENGAQVDAEARYLTTFKGAVSVGYGVRYVNQTLSYARTGKTALRNAGILPFVELNLKL